MNSVLRRRGRRTSAAPIVAVIVFTLAVGAIIGALIPLLPWWFVLGMAVVPVGIFIALRYPTLGLPLFILAALLLPSYRVLDVAAVGYIAFLLLTRWKSFGAWLSRNPKLAVSIAVLVTFAVLLAIYSRLYLGYSSAFVYRDGRVILYWLFAAVVPVIVSGPKDLRRLEWGLVGVGCVIAAIATVQSVFGISLTATGTTSSLQTLSTVESDVVRSQIPGMTFVIAALFWLVAQYLGRRVSVIWVIFLGGVLASGLFFNFGRALWAWTALGFVVLVASFGFARMLKMLSLAACFLVVAAGVLAIASPKLLDAATERVVSVSGEGGSNTSYGWRKAENDQALRAFAGSPLVGIGLGGEYKKTVSFVAGFEDQSRFIHNAYLFLLVKLGIAGAIIVAWLLWNGLFSRLRSSLASEGPRVGARAYFVAAMLTLGLSVTQPELMVHYGVLFLAVCIGMLVAFRDTSDASLVSEDPATIVARNARFRGYM